MDKKSSSIDQTVPSADIDPSLIKTSNEICYSFGALQSIILIGGTSVHLIGFHHHLQLTAQDNRNMAEKVTKT